MLGIDGLCATPSLEGFEEGDYETPGDYKRKRRQSVGGKWSWQSHMWRHGNLLLPEMCFNIKKHKLLTIPLLFGIFWLVPSHLLFLLAFLVDFPCTFLVL